jgi:hypothetical protein
VPPRLPVSRQPEALLRSAPSSRALAPSQVQATSRALAPSQVRATSRALAPSQVRAPSPVPS